jgi:FG-GAP-like repeat/Abnormal spindle-like microcephaly-assoc'd, ASPM-SPD-2-Hydin/Protein of unknown function (DUF1573)/FG-GAP repeat
MRTHATLLGAVLLGFVSILSYAQAPVPFINQPLIPDATAPGGPQFTLSVNGTGFVSNSVVNWNGSTLATQFVSGSQLTAIVPATDVATASTASLTVVNPAPGGKSNVAFFTATPDTGKSVGFGSASSPATGTYPQSVAVGDFNGDGKLDLAVANGGSSTVSILLGDGTGNLTMASSAAVGKWPISVAVGDFNGDGKLDLAVANDDDDTVSVLLGDGTGNFTLASSPAAGGYPTSVAVGDFNGDGKLDLAVANSASNTVSILLGDGTGNFTLASSPATGLEPYSVAVGDFNGDGKLDLAVANVNSSTVSIMLGDGTGNFTLASSPATGQSPVSVAVGDFNGDGKLDLAVANAGSNTISMLLGDGNGNFTLASSPATGLQPYSVAVGDFNGDGKLDLVVANLRSGSVSVLLGDGAGNFTLASSHGTGDEPDSVAVGDFNGDGKLDLAVANWYSNTVSILEGATPPVEFSPTQLNFGTLIVGTKSDYQFVILTNIGSVTLDISKIAASWNYFETNKCPASLPPGRRCVIKVTFKPHGRFTLPGTVTITDNAPNSPQTLPLTGVGTWVTLLPSSLDFGKKRVGTSSHPRTVMLSNYGKGTMSIHGIHISGTNSRQFSQTNNCGTSVPAGGSCSISVTFAPKSKRIKTATLDVNDNGGASPQTVALSGKGTE